MRPENGAADTPSGRQPKSEGSDVKGMLCSCVELTYAQAAAYMRENPSITFDAFLSATGAGEVCTACRLDLEYAFTTGELRPIAGSETTAPPPSSKPRARHRLYAVIDKLSPLAGLVPHEAAPVLLGRHLRQSIAVANDRFMYGDETAPEPPPMDVEIVARDSEGQVRRKMRYRVLAGEAIDVPVSDWLEPHDETSLTCGSVEIRRRWTLPGLRGTTRPQIVIEGDGGCSAVHTQGINGPRELWFTGTGRSGSERSFVAVANCGPQARYTIEYPYAPGVSETERCRVDTMLPAWGARAFEIAPHDAAVRDDDATFGIRIEASGPHKWFMVTASPSLDRVAIDHPAGG